MDTVTKGARRTRKGKQYAGSVVRVYRVPYPSLPFFLVYRLHYISFRCFFFCLLLRYIHKKCAVYFLLLPEQSKQKETNKF